jgi:hypothetical protein
MRSIRVAAVSSEYYRILSLDGGGTWALIQLRALMRLFGKQASGHDVLRAFDLVAANSGGAVVLGGMAVDLPLAKILEFFEVETQRMSVFRSTAFEKFVDVVGHGKLPLPRYSTGAKYDGLLQHLGERGRVPLGSWRRSGSELPDLLFTAFDYDTERAAFFRTNKESLAASRTSSGPDDVTLVDAVHSSANPPVLYFDGPTRVPHPHGSFRFWDGGVAGYNNPAMAATLEALANGIERSVIRVLAIGTGTVRRPRRPADAALDDPRFTGGQAPGVLGDLKELAGAILDDPPDAASFHAHVSLGGALPTRPGEVVASGPVIRANPVVGPTREGSDWDWPLETLEPEQWARLTELDLDAVAQKDVDLIGLFCDHWLAGKVFNQPIRAGADLRAEVGHDTFPAARMALEEWLPLEGADGASSPA